MNMNQRSIFFARFSFLVFVLTMTHGQEKSFSSSTGTAITTAYRGFRLEDCLLLSRYVLHSAECAQYCLRDKRCESFNYESHTSLMEDIIDSNLCELNSCTKRTHREKLNLDPHFIYHELIRQKMNVETDHEENLTTENPTTNHDLSIIA